MLFKSIWLRTLVRSFKVRNTKLIDFYKACSKWNTLYYHLMGIFSLGTCIISFRIIHTSYAIVSVVALLIFHNMNNASKRVVLDWKKCQKIMAHTTYTPLFFLLILFLSICFFSFFFSLSLSLLSHMKIDLYISNETCCFLARFNLFK